MLDDSAGQSDRSFVGHPRGLAYIVFTDVWEKFSYYGMQTLLLHAALVAAATACMGAAAWLFRRRFGVAVEGAREADSTSIARP